MRYCSAGRRAFACRPFAAALVIEPGVPSAYCRSSRVPEEEEEVPNRSRVPLHATPSIRSAVPENCARIYSALYCCATQDETTRHKCHNERAT